MNFEQFFKKATGFGPFPYQKSLAEADLSRLALAAPTGAGKTAAAVLAWLWQRREKPKETPTRLILCEPQRTLVEQVFNEVHRWLKNLDLLAETGDPLIFGVERDKVSLHALQGGFIDEEWELCPEQPAVIIGTQDQLLSRALNRGYAMSRFRWPIHFGLFHNDVQWVFDEIQLMGPGLVTSAQLHGLRGAEKLHHYGQARSLWMSATLNLEWLNTIDHPVDADHPLKIHPFGEADREVEMMKQRLHASKPLYKLPVALSSTTKGDTKAYLNALSEQVLNLHKTGQFTLIILNTVDRARELHKELGKTFQGEPLYLLHSRFRPADRQKILAKILEGNGEKIVVSTQVVEAGVDFSADLLVTELSPRSSMIQRFGRCNRKGEQPHAEVHWTDLEGDKACLPYSEDDLNKARDIFQYMDSVEPARFGDSVNDPWPVYDTLRRRDLLDLFDTTPDLSGLTLDVGRFIRDGEERDIFLFWRKWDYEIPPLELPGPDHRELCKAKLSDVREAVKKSKLAVWYLDDLQGSVAEWRQARLTDLVPGRTFLLHSDEGFYSEESGWTPGLKHFVSDLSGDKFESPFPTMVGDPLSEEVHKYLTLWQHTKDVRDELNKLIRQLDVLPAEVQESLITAALWHDVGKSHKVFQDTMTRGAPWEIDRNELWAKRVGSARHFVRYFRHELASALAALQHELPFLVTYLIASHHGKARLSVRALPEEQDDRILGIGEGDVLPEISFPDLKLSPTTLSLEPFALGVGSWQDRNLRLLDEMGPFRLAYLEAVLRAADVRASIKEKRENK